VTNESLTPDEAVGDHRSRATVATFHGDDPEFRAEIRGWLDSQLSGPFAGIRGRGGPGHEHEDLSARQEWEQCLGAAGWIGIGWPSAFGGREASFLQQVIFHEEYARAGGPGRLGHIGEQLVAPTLLAFGTPEQCERFLPGIRSGEILWCQGYSEPNAGSDLAGVRTSARLEDGEWRITGQKVWTSLAHLSQWCFVLARTDPGEQRHRGLSYLLVPMDQPGIDIRPIRQLTGTSEFNEVFFDEARAAAEDVVGGAGNGWKVAMATLGFERGVSTLGQQIGFRREFEEVLDAARESGALANPSTRRRLIDAWIDLQVVAMTALATLTSSSDGTVGVEASVNKLQWATWHRSLGELAVQVSGPAGLIVADEPYELSSAQTLLLHSRSDTIYGGSNEIQLNVIAERMLGMPRG
jgi:alkylation response protein AidB-like acyl-CoA dehydrogenase